MMRRLIILIMLLCSFVGLQARQNIDRSQVDALQRAWKTGDATKAKGRPTSGAVVSDNVRERFVDAYMMEKQGRRQLAAGAYLEIIDSLKAAPELYIHANVALADFYRNKPAYEKAYSEYLLKAAESMARARQINPETYVELGNYLISKGYRNQGEQALKIAAMRMAESGYHQSASELTSIASAESTRRQTTIWFILCLSIFIAVAAIIFAIYMMRQNVQTTSLLQRKEADIQSDNERKREITANFIALALKGVESLKDFNTYVMRKLAAGQAKALYGEAESGSFLQNVTEGFFEEFDTLFLNSYPDFIEKLNGLIKPDRRFSLAEDGRLSPELRIAAFMMMGISDTAKIAQVMNLSVNTIYTYRNRLRSRALDRETFENRLLSLRET